jgi:carboxyl-terminal processing protease
MQGLKTTSIALATTLFALSLLSLSFKRGDNEFEVSKNLEIFASIFRELNAYYVDDLQSDKLVRTGIDAMLESLDPYTNYIDEAEMENYRLQTTGKYGGIGAVIRASGEKDKRYVVIAEPYEGSPAQRTGIMAGDQILEIDGKSMKNKSTDDVSKMLKGTPGTDVRILLDRPGESKPIEKTIKREEIKLKSVPYYGMLPDKKTGYIRFTNFTENCSEAVKDALVELRDKQKAQSIILDLRDNPGGLLDEAVAVANIFINKGQEVVSTRGRVTDAESKIYKANDTPTDLQIPLAVLIDNGSASASEIVSGTIQDLDRGVVIGERSYGKGLVQTTKNVGYNSKLKITTAKYYLPSGRCIQAIDYADNRNDHKKQPDSLHTSFKTKGGRTVYDSGGIKPDLEVDKPYLGNITVALATKNLLFDYATQYRVKHPTIASPDKFELSDADYNDFINFLADKDYAYTTESEALLKKLRENAEKEQYADALKTEIGELEAKMKLDKSNDLQKFKAEIKNMLEIEIVTRYFWQRGQIQESIEEDPDLQKAVEIINNPANYKKLLGQQ